MSEIFTMEMLWGLIIGVLFSIGDALLLRWTVQKSGQASKRNWLMRGIVARASLTAAVIALAFALPFVNAAGVVIALLIQKTVLVGVALINLGKRP